MSKIISNCPRCGAQKITFDVKQQHHTETKYKWQHWLEIFCICRHCFRSITFIVSQKEREASAIFGKTNGILEIRETLNKYVTIERFVDIRDKLSKPQPEHIPENIKNAFVEATTCMNIGCWSASGVMFRKCVDLATREMLPTVDENGLTKHIRRNLSPRLEWLFNQQKISSQLKELSHCIKEDGNDGAHDVPLTKEDAEDLYEFTFVLLEKIYTEPMKIELAQQRRDARRQA